MSKNKFKVLHQESSVTPFTLELIHRGFHQKLQKKYLSPHSFNPTAIAYEDYKITWYGDWNNFLILGDRVIEGVSNDPGYSKRLLREIIQQGQKLYRFNQKIEKLKLHKLSNYALGKLLAEQYRLAGSICDLGFVAIASDLRHDKLTTVLKKILQKKSVGVKSDSIGEYFSNLVLPTQRSFADNEQIEVFRLALVIVKNPTAKKVFLKESPMVALYWLENHNRGLYRSLKKIHSNYSWLNFGHFGPEKTLEDYVQEIRNLIVNKKISGELKLANQELEEIVKKQKIYSKQLGLGKSEQQLFAAARDFGFNKKYRYEMLMNTYYTMSKILREISKRIGLTVMEIRFTSLEETLLFLKGRRVLSSEKIAERRKFCVTLTTGDQIRFLSGSKAREYIKNSVEYEKIKKDLTSIHGNVAFVGIVTGRVRIVNSPKDLSKVGPGDVLVSIQTNPDLLPAMKKAGAFVTDVGGITSHASIVAREMKKPCVIGTKIATQIFKDGDLVEVDANKGIVRKI